jgi:hypothetical protein
MVSTARVRRSLQSLPLRVRMKTSGLRVLPDFLIIGAHKCGAASLFTYVLEHPQVVAPVATKEIHYFDRHFGGGPQWYRAQFRTRLAVRGRLITGEKSPYYIFDPGVPLRARSTVPNAKLIAIVRDPVERAYSHYHMRKAEGREKLSFEEALEAEPVRLASGDYSSFEYRRFAYLLRGLYADQLERWLSLFPREQLLVISTEDLGREPEKTVDECFRFLGVSAWRRPPREYARRNVGTYEPMLPETKEQLARFFEPHNRRLYELLGRDLGWTRPLEARAASGEPTGAPSTPTA